MGEGVRELLPSMIPEPKLDCDEGGDCTMPAGIGTDVCNCRAVLLDAVVIGGVWYGNVRGSLGVEENCTVFGAVDVMMEG